MPVLRTLSLIAAVVAASAAQAALLGAQTAGTSTPPADRHKQVDALFAPWNGTTAPGCAVAISRDGVPDYVRGYGMANLEYDIAIAPDAVFNVASVSKQFTAFAIALLAQDGKLSLQDDIRKHLPELPDLGHTVTIAHMLHHTAGLREEAHLLYLAGRGNGEIRTEADVLRLLAKQRRLNFAPGAEVVYSNSHYTLLATIVHRVSGVPLRQFADERIFAPLGMTDTHFQNGVNEVVRRRAWGYNPAAAGAWRIVFPASDFYGAGNLLTTVGDLLKWEQNLLDPRVGGRTAVDAIATSGTLNGGLATGYGGGLRIARHRGLRTIGHDGLGGGYRTAVLAFPDQRLVVAALCNTGAIPAEELVPKVADVYLGDRMTTETRPAVKVPEAELSALAGVYWNEPFDAVIRLEFKDGALHADGSRDPVVPLGDGTFRAPGLPNEWRFSAPAAGAPATAPRELRIWDSWPTPRLFTRLTAPVPTPAALAKYAGQYRSDEVDVTYVVGVENGRLSVRWGHDSTFTLTAAGGDHFVDGAYTVTFTRGASGDVDGLTISTRRVRRLRADRLPIPAPPERRS